MSKFRRIGILGGSFNPIHIGHLVLAEQAKHLLCLEKIIFVPAYLPPHKRTRSLALARERYQMVALAVKSNPFFKVCDLEIKRQGISYSIETVKQFRSTFKKSILYFIIGSDSLKELYTWKDISEFGKICKFVVAQRPGHSLQDLLLNSQSRLPLIKQGRQKLPSYISTINIPALDISSTQIRKRIKYKESIRYLVPEEVRKYILRKRLYR